MMQDALSCIMQVLDLGTTEVVSAWDEGDAHFEEVATQPDYDR
jgi:hypothetical protein